MFKTERDNNLDSRYTNSKEPVSSRYLQDSKKKYNLASVDHNLEQLKEEQLKTLTDLLIDLKGQYDELIRDTTIKKKETEKIGKQIEMLDKMEKKTKSKINEMEENHTNMESLIEIKKVRREEEAYTRNTLLNLMEKMKNEMLIVKKEINSLEVESKHLKKKYEKEKIRENDIKEKINQVYSKIYNKRMKNSFDRSENNLVLQYYHNIIDQKWSFIYSADERKAKQIKITKDAKNDSQDKQEVEKRNMLFLLMLYDRYLRVKMDKELRENEKLEETFQTIKDITGSGNLKTMVDKILNKDKNYNHCVSQVAQKQAKIAILNKDLSRLEADYQKLKNAFTDEENSKTPSELNSTMNTSTINPSLLEEEETKMLAEEKALMEELKLMQEKHKNVKLVYEKVVSNVRSLCKMESKKDDTINITQSQIVNLNDSRVMDSSNINNQMNNQSSFNINAVNEEDLLKNYTEYLETTKKTIDGLFLIHKKEDFMKMMREKGIEPVTISRSVSKRGTMVKKGPTLSSAVSMDKGSVKDLIVRPVGNEEYEYDDEELKKEDNEIREEKDEIIRHFKAIVNYFN